MGPDTRLERVTSRLPCEYSTNDELVRRYSNRPRHQIRLGLVIKQILLPLLIIGAHVTEDDARCVGWWPAAIYAAMSASFFHAHVAFFLLQAEHAATKLSQVSRPPLLLGTM